MPILTDFNGPNGGLVNSENGISFWFELDTDGELPPYEMDTGVEMGGFQLNKTVDPNTSEIRYTFIPKNIVVKITSDALGYRLHIVDNNENPPQIVLEADITEGDKDSIVAAFDNISPLPDLPPANAVGGRRRKHRKTHKQRKQKTRKSRKGRKSQRRRRS